MGVMREDTRRLADEALNVPRITYTRTAKSFDYNDEDGYVRFLDKRGELIVALEVSLIQEVWGRIVEACSGSLDE